MPRTKKTLQENRQPLLETEEGQLTIDVYQEPDAFVIQSVVAGVKPEDVDVKVTDDTVVIRGKRERDQSFSQEGFLYQECFWGSFSRTVILPGKVDPSGVTASLKNGVLTVRLPKAKGV